MSVDLALVREAAGSTPDPEIRRPIASMGLLDEVEVHGGHAVVRYHLTSPLCPSKFALRIGKEIKRRVEAVPGVESCEVILQDHYELSELTDLVNVRIVT
jgi:metal-sulfur cluster biosynthetic enzyme